MGMYLHSHIRVHVVMLNEAWEYSGFRFVRTFMYTGTGNSIAS